MTKKLLKILFKKLKIVKTS